MADSKRLLLVPLLLLVMVISLAYAEVTDTVTTYSDSGFSAEATNFKESDTIYVRAYYTDELSDTKESNITDDSDPSNNITITIYDDGNGPGDTANDGHYTGSFTISQTTATNDATDNIMLSDNGTVTINATNTTAFTNITADFSMPYFAVDVPTATSYGSQISVSVNVTDDISGVDAGKTRFWLGNATNTSKTSLSCSASDRVYTCTSAYSTGSLSGGVYTFWVNATDIAGNSNMTFVSGVVVNNTVPRLNSRFVPKNYSTFWYLQPDDSFIVTGNMTDARNNLMNGTITATLTLSGADIFDSQQTINSSTGNFTFVFNFTGASIGTGTLNVTATDSFGNSNTSIATVYITNQINYVSIELSNPSKDNYIGGETPTITLTAMDSFGNKVHGAHVTMTITEGGSAANTDLVVTDTTDSNGEASYAFNIPLEKYRSYPISVTAYSPLNTSKTVTNTSIVPVEYVEIDFSWYPDEPCINDSINVTGNLTFHNSTYTSNIDNIITYSVLYYKNNATNVSYRVPGHYEKLVSTGYFSKFSLPLIKIENWTRYWIIVNATIPSYKYGTNFEKSMEIVSTRVKTFVACEKSGQTNATTGENADAAYSLNISEYPNTVGIEPGASQIMVLKVTNLGQQPLSNIGLSLTSNLSLENWYVLSTDYAGVINYTDEALFDITISIPSDAQFGSYYVRAKATSNESDVFNETEFTLVVMPSVSGVEKNLTDMRSEIEDLTDRINKLLKTVSNETVKNSINDKFSAINRLYAEAKGAAEQGSYLTALTKVQEADEFMFGLKDILESEESKLSASLHKRYIILGVILFILVLIAGFLYLWIPPKGYKPSKELFRRGKSKESILNKIKKIFRKNGE